MMGNQTLSAELLDARLRRCDHCGSAGSLIPNADGDPYCLTCGFVLVEVPDFIHTAIKRYDLGDRRALMSPRYRGMEL